MVHTNDHLTLALNSMASKHSEIKWSGETMTISDIVRGSLPVLVRVSEGYLGNNEAETFSIGDLLRLDCVKSIQKICATVIPSLRYSISEDDTGSMQPDHEVIIPLGYQGKVFIIRPPNDRRIYRTVNDLVQDFPRYVRVESAFTAKSARDKLIQVNVGKRLKLIRHFPNMGLLVKYEGSSVIISNDVTARFIPLSDGRHYTLKEVVDNLPLPQYVRFVGDEFEKVLTTDLLEALENVQAFNGCVKLTRVFNEDIIVGHHTPHLENFSSSAKCDDEKYVHRSIVLLPIGRDFIDKMEVNVPVYSQPDEYDLLAIRNFSQRTPTMDLVEGSLYLEFTRKPKSFHKIKEERIDTKSNAPPVPPRPYADTNRPPRRPPRTSISSFSGSDDSDEDYESVDLIKETSSNINEDIQLPIRSKPPATPRGKVARFLKRLPLPIVQSPESKNSKSPNATLENKIKWSTSPEKLSPQVVENPNYLSDCESQKVSGSVLFPETTEVERRPIGKIQPSARHAPNSEGPRVSQMSVKELVNCLRQCALSNLADLCDEHKVDGQFFMDIEEEDLREAPYNLNGMEIRKFKKMKKGWRPRIE